MVGRITDTKKNGIIQSVPIFIASINHMGKEVVSLEEQLDKLIDETGYLLKTVQGVDTVLAATFIANIGISRFKYNSQIAKLAVAYPLNIVLVSHKPVTLTSWATEN